MAASRVVLAGLLGGLLVSAGYGSGPVSAAAPPAVDRTDAFVRVDQSGYATHGPKLAYVLAAKPLRHPVVDVLDRRGRRVVSVAAQPRGAWSVAYPAVYGVDFSTVGAPGAYRLALRGTTAVTPVTVRPSRTIWSPVLAKGLAFDRLQRDGARVVPGPLHRRPAHRHDRSATVYRWPTFTDPDSDVIADADLRPVTTGPRTVDLEGGWSDAGDYLKFAHSSAYADVLLYAAARDAAHGAAHGAGLRRSAGLLREARHGTRWLLKTWDVEHSILYLQVGIGSGNEAGTFLGDHDGWRLPEADDGNTDPAARYVAHRPVFRANEPGQPVSPNLAGRVSAALALAARADARSHPVRARRELAAATSLYRAADVGSPPDPLTTALPNAFYPESTWHDDMELGAVEIAGARRALDRPDAAWVRAAAHWARAYVAHDAGDTFNLYDVSALAHTELLRRAGHGPLHAHLRSVLLHDLRRQLATAARHGVDEPFRAGASDTEFDVDSHTLGLVATEGWYRSVGGDRSYVGLAASLRGWVFGANAWGTSFMVGVGTTFPHCMQHQVANLNGSTDGRAPLATGAVVNGPNSAGLFTDGLGGFQDGMVPCAGAKSAVPAGRFDGSGSVYLDDVRSWQTDEPALDMTGAAIVAASAQLGAHRG